MECEAGVQKMVIYVHERRKVIRALDTSARYRVKFSSLYACNRRNILPRTLFGYQFEIELAYWRKSNLRNTTTKRKVSKWIAVFTRLAAKISNSASGDRLSELNWLDSAVQSLQCQCANATPRSPRLSEAIVCEKIMVTDRHDYYAHRLLLFFLPFTREG